VDLDLRLVRYFVAVATDLHFGRAAERLYISQPALSKQIRRLEDELGFALLVRDSRHVGLTLRGERFLDDARQLLATAERMVRPQDSGTLRMAHIFELDTSRVVVDAFLASNPSVRVVESSMDSAHQLEALLSGQVDVALLRVTAGMIARYPTGWRYRLLRLEPFWLVGRPGDESAVMLSLHDRPIEVFAEPMQSPLYSAHGQYMTCFEEQTGIALSWLGNPGTYDNCLAIIGRSTQRRHLLEFDSYARRYADCGIAIHRPAELQPVYPWSIAWRDEPVTDAVTRFVAEALASADRSGWWDAPPDTAPMWTPAEDPIRDQDLPTPWHR
jgi:DNA-binding transcriptional LysR family regulator